MNPSGFKIPVRPAPAPPTGHLATHSSSNPSLLMDRWESFDDPFNDSFSKQGPSQITPWSDCQSSQKKVPPPRPPPPKVTLSKAGAKGAKHSKSNSKQPLRSGELLSNLFSRRGPKSEPAHTPGSSGSSSKNSTPLTSPISPSVATASLIDLSSPPSSPTPTTRSSSDGLSVDSFGSDGTTSHSHHHSQVESGFEDDVELFGRFTATSSPVNRDPWASSPSTPNDVFSPSGTSTTSSKSPWGSVPQDPFSPPCKTNIPPMLAPPSSVSSSVNSPGSLSFKPTIIRPKVKPNSSPSVVRAKSAASPSPNLIDDDRSDSPPMPSIPPPAPPPEFLTNSHSLPSAFGGLSVKDIKTGTPQCIALFDYESSHLDDLSFKEGDVIEIVKEMGEEWMCGRIGNKEGMFPVNFVKVLIPLTSSGDLYANALYNFTAETWEDLDLKKGAKVRLISRINDDWLYGECNGKCGQFPAAFVDNVPSALPMHS